MRDAALMRSARSRVLLPAASGARVLHDGARRGGGADDRGAGSNAGNEGSATGDRFELLVAEFFLGCFGRTAACCGLRPESWLS